MRSLASRDASHSHGREIRPDAARFCTHCGAVQDDAPQRVCERCGFGIILTAAREVLGKTFLVVTLDQRISAASAAIEEILGDGLVGLPLPAVLSGDDLGRLIARIAWCGQPPAALVVLD
jgi:hypothetical protein